MASTKDSRFLPQQTGTGGHVWNYKLRREFECAGRTVYVFLSALRKEIKHPTFDVVWLPNRPSRLTPDDIAKFDLGRKKAEAALLAELEALP